MPDRIFLDTVFVIALINQRDSNHIRALRLADELEGHPLVTTDAVLLEIGMPWRGDLSPKQLKLLMTYCLLRKLK